MAKQTLNAGDVISVTPLNSNFTELYDSVSSLTTTTSSHTSSISTLNTNVSNLQAAPITTLTASSGKISPADETVNKYTTAGNTEIALPTVVSEKLHQIMIFLKKANASHTITFSVASGSVMYFNGVAPDFTGAGAYTILCEYDVNYSSWCVGAVYKSVLTS